MGSYLSAPITEKESESGTLVGHSYGASSMQGWRRSQEDAHVASSLPDGTVVFAVFDGHGGREVSNFAKKRFASTLQSQGAFKSDLAKALPAAFHATHTHFRPSLRGSFDRSWGSRPPSATAR